MCIYFYMRQSEDKESPIFHASQVRGSTTRHSTPEFNVKDLLGPRTVLRAYFPFFLDSFSSFSTVFFFLVYTSVCARRVLSVIYDYKVKDQELAS